MIYYINFPMMKIKGIMENALSNVKNGPRIKIVSAFLPSKDIICCLYFGRMQNSKILFTHNNRQIPSPKL